MRAQYNTGFSYTVALYLFGEYVNVRCWKNGTGWRSQQRVRLDASRLQLVAPTAYSVQMHTCIDFSGGLLKQAVG